MSNRRTAAVMCGEFLKLLRSQKLSRREIKDQSGLHESTITAWLQEFVQLGILECERGDPPTDGRPGYAPMLYFVASAWGGTCPAMVPPLRLTGGADGVR